MKPPSSAPSTARPFAAPDFWASAATSPSLSGIAEPPNSPLNWSAGPIFPARISPPRACAQPLAGPFARCEALQSIKIKLNERLKPSDQLVHAERESTVRPALCAPGSSFSDLGHHTLEFAYATRVTFAAFSPLGPCWHSNSTASPSFSVL